MSVEQLLFLLLVGLPLLERLIRVMRTGGSSGDRPPVPARETASGARPPMPPPDAGATPAPSSGAELPLPAPPLPEIPDAVAEQSRAFERQRRVRREPRPLPAAGWRAAPKRPLAFRRVIADDDLRRAVVLMAVLGPCRALEPMDAASPRSST